ncbi:MAG: LVIVD repeat-containing protein, partial [Armatimonadota bacterium]
APRRLGALRVGEAQGIRIHRNLAYVGLWHNRKLAVVDIENPRRPLLRGEAALGGYGWGISLHNGFVYAATGHHAPGEGGDDRGHGLDVVDVRDPANPRSVKRLNTPPHYRLGNDWWWVTASGQHAFHADGENGVFVYDIQDPVNPRPVAHAETADYSGMVALLENRILVADMKGGLRLFDAEGLAAPAPRRREEARDFPPAQPQDASGPGYVMHETGGQARRVAVMGDYAIVAAGMAALEVLSLSPKVRRVATVATPGVAFDVKVRGSTLYAALGSAGVAVIDASDPLHAEIIGRLEGRAADHVQPVGEYLATMRGEGGVDLLDVREASAPAFLARGSIPHFPSQLSSLGDRYLLGVSPWEIAVFDVARPRQLAKTVLSETDRDGAAGVMVNGTRALVCRRSELQLWDVADLDDIRPLGSLSLPPGSGGVVEWRGSRAVVCNRVTGSAAFVDVGDGGAMRLLKVTRLPGYPGKATIHGELALVPCGYSGLAIINWQDIPKLR